MDSLQEKELSPTVEETAPVEAEETAERELTEADYSKFGQFIHKMKAFFRGKNKAPKKHSKMVSYAKYGYIFLVPFFVIFLIFQLVPLVQTFYYSFCEYYEDLLDTVGPTWNNFQNYKTVLGDGQLFTYFGNTMLLWILGFVPQIITSLLLAIWFTDSRLKLKFTGFFKAVTYMPNLVMAAAFGMLFLMIFGQNGPINAIIKASGGKTITFGDSTPWSRGIIAFIDWIMWFGNTAILLMSGIMGIDESIFESARLDGSSAFRTFWKITMPLLMPIFVFVLITSLIGGIQLFDAVQFFTRGQGGPAGTTQTVMMYLYKEVVGAQNYGLAGAISVLLFLLTGVLSIIIFKVLIPNNNAIKAEQKAYRRRMHWLKNAHAEEDHSNKEGA